jgi:xanthine dehydrogenase YagS FAD-binding subunit
LQGDKNGIKNGRIVLGGAAPIPWLEKEVSDKLTGFTPNKENVERLAAAALKDAEPLAQNEYKITLARTLIKRLLGQLTT